ncbi:MAG: hypothetical protein HHJ10_00780, partial [Cellulomonas sp.]|uniref:hypothetical protein n=1 Tax=Cellulomonas sp. TaxID=40001 RepID=UPI0018005142
MITRATTDPYVPLPPAPAIVTTVPDPTVRYRVRGLGLPVVPGHQEYVDRVLDHRLSAPAFAGLRAVARHLGVTA